MPIGPPFNLKTTKGFSKQVRAALLLYAYEESQGPRAWEKLKKLTAEAFTKKGNDPGVLAELEGKPSPTRKGLFIFRPSEERSGYLAGWWTPGGYGSRFSLSGAAGDVDVAQAELIIDDLSYGKLACYCWIWLSQRRIKLRRIAAFIRTSNESGSATTTPYTWTQQADYTMKLCHNFRRGNTNVLLFDDGRIDILKVITEPAESLQEPK